MSNRAMLLSLRVLLLLAVLLSIAASMLFNDYSHRVIASATGGISVGILVSLILEQVSKSNPKLWRELNKNVAEAQQLLQPIRSAYGTPNDWSATSVKQNMSEMIEHPIVILLFLTITWIIWLDPAFTDSGALNQNISIPVAKMLGTHFLALFSMTTSVFGAISTVRNKLRNAP